MVAWEVIGRLCNTLLFTSSFSAFLACLAVDVEAMQTSTFQHYGYKVTLKLFGQTRLVTHTNVNTIISELVTKIVFTA